MTHHGPSIAVVAVFVANVSTYVQAFACTLGSTEPPLVIGGDRVQSRSSKQKVLN